MCREFESPHPNTETCGRCLLSCSCCQSDVRSRCCGVIVSGTPEELTERKRRLRSDRSYQKPRAAAKRPVCSSQTAGCPASGQETGLFKSDRGTPAPQQGLRTSVTYGPAVRSFGVPPCNAVRKCRTFRLHSSVGQNAALSRRRRGFKSPLSRSVKPDCSRVCLPDNVRRDRTVPSGSSAVQNTVLLCRTLPVTAGTKNNTAP